MRRDRRAASTVAMVTVAIPAEPTRKVRRLTDGGIIGKHIINAAIDSGVTFSGVEILSG
jgi:hypothetical protein